ncbi:hypothetical protein PPERSA_10317 [Pseudocohnilembus persalinus]|uniref:Uncharacterized protein n=1 Tax=Pseudocohnilembus persalinus TaxID=266149 RepID=A0A0V0R062_PSEPJ|nr:hypothetical protein PPERSA_10317 [Pseudocohnilembus persalinus]|eukprot:KRX07929.1 hypothetical protein PPERSA_10317 [Pseudocohnilembus persalinus]
MEQQMKILSALMETNRSKVSILEDSIQIVLRNCHQNLQNMNQAQLFLFIDIFLTGYMENLVKNSNNLASISDLDFNSKGNGQSLYEHEALIDFQEIKDFYFQKVSDLVSILTARKNAQALQYKDIIILLQAIQYGMPEPKVFKRILFSFFENYFLDLTPLQIIGLGEILIENQKKYAGNQEFLKNNQLYKQNFDLNLKEYITEFSNLMNYKEIKVLQQFMISNKYDQQYFKQLEKRLKQIVNTLSVQELTSLILLRSNYIRNYQNNNDIQKDTFLVHDVLKSLIKELKYQSQNIKDIIAILKIVSGLNIVQNNSEFMLEFLPILSKNCSIDSFDNYMVIVNFILYAQKINPELEEIGNIVISELELKYSQPKKEQKLEEQRKIQEKIE